MNISLLTVFARREPTSDSATHSMYKAQGRPQAANQHQDVQVYCDRKARKPFARFPWHYSSCPTRRNRTVTINCYRWRLAWI